MKTMTRTYRFPWLLGILALPFVLAFSILLALFTLVAVSLGMVWGALTGNLTIDFKS